MFHRSPNNSADHHSVLGFRESEDGGLEQVIAEVNCISGKSSRPQLIPTEAKSLCLNLSGGRFAYQTGREIQVADRKLWQSTFSDVFVADSFLIALSDRTPEQLDLMGEFILKNDFWWQYGVSSQDAYTQFSEELAELWYELQTEKQPTEETKQRLELLDNWLEKGSELALLTSAFSPTGRRMASSRGNGRSQLQLRRKRYVRERAQEDQNRDLSIAQKT